jgi:hypothetical protein
MILVEGVPCRADIESSARSSTSLRIWALVMASLRAPKSGGSSKSPIELRAILRRLSKFRTAVDVTGGAGFLHVCEMGSRQYAFKVRSGPSLCYGFDA